MVTHHRRDKVCGFSTYHTSGRGTRNLVSCHLLIGLSVIVAACIPFSIALASFDPQTESANRVNVAAYPNDAAVFVRISDGGLTWRECNGKVPVKCFSCDDSSSDSDSSFARAAKSVSRNAFAQADKLSDCACGQELLWDQCEIKYAKVAACPLLEEEGKNMWRAGMANGIFGLITSLAVTPAILLWWGAGCWARRVRRKHIMRTRVLLFSGGIMLVGIWALLSVLSILRSVSFFSCSTCGANACNLEAQDFTKGGTGTERLIGSSIAVLVFAGLYAVFAVGCCACISGKSRRNSMSIPGLHWMCCSSDDDCDCDVFNPYNGPCCSSDSDCDCCCPSGDGERPPISSDDYDEGENDHDPDRNVADEEAERRTVTPSTARSSEGFGHAPNDNDVVVGGGIGFGGGAGAVTGQVVGGGGAGDASIDDELERIDHELHVHVAPPPLGQQAGPNPFFAPPPPPGVNNMFYAPQPQTYPGGDERPNYPGLPPGFGGN